MRMHSKLLVLVVSAAVALVGVSMASAEPVRQTVTHGTFSFSGGGGSNGCGLEIVTGEGKYTEIDFRNVTPSGRVTSNAVINSSFQYTTSDGNEFISHSTNTSNQTFSLDNSSGGHYSQIVFVHQINLGVDAVGDEFYIYLHIVRTIDANGNVTQEHVESTVACR